MKVRDQMKKKISLMIGLSIFATGMGNEVWGQTRTLSIPDCASLAPADYNSYKDDLCIEDGKIMALVKSRSFLRWVNPGTWKNGPNIKFVEKFQANLKDLEGVTINATDYSAPGGGGATKNPTYKYNDIDVSKYANLQRCDKIQRDVAEKDKPYCYMDTGRGKSFYKIDEVTLDEKKKEIVGRYKLKRLSREMQYLLGVASNDQKFRYYDPDGGSVYTNNLPSADDVPLVQVHGPKRNSNSTPNSNPGHSGSNNSPTGGGTGNNYPSSPYSRSARTSEVSLGGGGYYRAIRGSSDLESLSRKCTEIENAAKEHGSLVSERRTFLQEREEALAKAEAKLGNAKKVFAFADCVTVCTEVSAQDSCKLNFTASAVSCESILEVPECVSLLRQKKCTGIISWVKALGEFEAAELSVKAEKDILDSLEGRKRNGNCTIGATNWSSFDPTVASKRCLEQAVSSCLDFAQSEANRIKDALLRGDCVDGNCGSGKNTGISKAAQVIGAVAPFAAGLGGALLNYSMYNRGLANCNSMYAQALDVSLQTGKPPFMAPCGGMGGMMGGFNGGMMGSMGGMMNPMMMGMMNPMMSGMMMGPWGMNGMMGMNGMFGMNGGMNGMFGVQQQMMDSQMRMAALQGQNMAMMNGMYTNYGLGMNGMMNGMGNLGMMNPMMNMYGNPMMMGNMGGMYNPWGMGTGMGAGLNINAGFNLGFNPWGMYGM